MIAQSEVATITTVGYGDTYPVTAFGRGVAFLLMLGGIAFFSGVTANLACLLTRDDSKKQVEEEEDRMDDRLREVRALGEEVAQLRGGQGGSG